MGGKPRLRRCLKCQKVLANWTQHVQKKHKGASGVPWEYPEAPPKRVAHTQRLLPPVPLFEEKQKEPPRYAKMMEERAGH